MIVLFWVFFKKKLKQVIESSLLRKSSMEIRVRAMETELAKLVKMSQPSEDFPDPIFFTQKQKKDFLCHGHPALS